MITNTQVNLLSFLSTPTSQPGLASSGNGIGGQRFDLTLLQVTKQSLNSSATQPENSAAITPKVVKAFENVLNTLSQRSTQTKGQLEKASNGSDVEATVSSQDTFAPTQTGKASGGNSVIGNLVDQAATEANLTVPERQQLDELVGMALNRMQSGKQEGSLQPSEMSANETNRVRTVLNSGPNGGTTVSPEPASQQGGKNHDLASSGSMHGGENQAPTWMAALAPAPSQFMANLGTPGAVNLNTPIESPVIGTNEGKVVSSSGVAQSSQGTPTSSVAQTPSQHQPLQDMTMQQDSQPFQGFVQGIPVAVAAADSQEQAPVTASPMKPENNNQTNRSQATAAGASNVEKEHAQTFAQAQQRGVSGQTQAMQPSGTASVPVQSTSSSQILPSDAPSMEILSSQEALPEIMPGSEIQFSDLEFSVSLQSQQASSGVKTNDILPVQSSMAPAGTAGSLLAGGIAVASQSNTTAVFQGLSPQGTSAPLAEGPIGIQGNIAGVSQGFSPAGSNSSQETNSKSAPSGNDTEEAQAPGTTEASTFQRVLDSSTQKTAATENAGTAQAPMALSNTAVSSVKDFAESVAKQYNMRQSVLQQAMAAIEDAGQGKNQIRIQLKPASLGTLDVSLTMDGGKLTARLIAGNNDVRDVLAGNLAQFKQALEAQGLQVSQLSVAVRSDGGSQSQAQQQWQQNQPQWQMAKQNVPVAANSWKSFSTAGIAPSGNSLFSALA